MKRNVVFEKEEHVTHYLVYWHTYWQDEENGTAQVTPAWYTDNRKFYDRVEKKDNLWVVVNGGKKAPGEWRLIQRFILSKVNPSQVESGWGRYEIIGYRKGNQVFDIEQQPDFTAILWMLEFSTGNHINYLGRKIGQSLQTHGQRVLTESDVVLLEKYSKQLRRK